MRENLNKTEYYDVYGISLLKRYNLEENNYLLALLMPIAEKYLRITTFALRSELRYFFTSVENTTSVDMWYIKKYRQENRKLLKSMKIKSFKTNRKKLKLNQMLVLYEKGTWGKGQYGGEKWAEICRECIMLKDYIKEKSLEKLLYVLDRLNDLEHNNHLYLSSYCKFDFREEAQVKSIGLEEEIIEHCSYDIKKLWRQN